MFVKQCIEAPSAVTFPVSPPRARWPASRPPQRGVTAMHLFKRTRTPPELVLKACNNYEDLARNATNQSVRAHPRLWRQNHALWLTRPACCLCHRR